MSETLEERIARHEGFCSQAHPDAKGMWVIGIGHDITLDEAKAQYPDGITYAEAEALLESDIAKVKQNCAQYFPWVLGLDEIRQEVIWEMAFQLGAGGVAEFKQMIADIRMQDWKAAANDMMASKWHEETPIRCQELSVLMLTGQSA